jgi:RNA polymerase sigma-70 factor (ECF subfamily)
MHSTSATLLQRLQKPGDAEAWRQFVHLYTPLLYQWTHRLGLQPADAADLVQEVLLKLYRALPQFQYDRQRSFRAWLFTLMRNKYQEWRRRPVPLPVGAVDDAPDEQAHHDGPAALEEEEYRSHLRSRALRLIQNEFTPPTWQAFWATAVDGRAAAEVAKELSLTDNAVYLARGRVLRRLREALDGFLD